MEEKEMTKKATQKNHTKSYKSYNFSCCGSITYYLRNSQIYLRL